MHAEDAYVSVTADTRTFAMSTPAVRSSCSARGLLRKERDDMLDGYHGDVVSPGRDPHSILTAFVDLAERELGAACDVILITFHSVSKGSEY
jgi:hypothetical protein